MSNLIISIRNYYIDFIDIICIAIWWIFIIRGSSKRKNTATCWQAEVICIIACKRECYCIAIWICGANIHNINSVFCNGIRRFQVSKCWRIICFKNSNSSWFCWCINWIISINSKFIYIISISICWWCKWRACIKYNNPVWRNR